jgi:hypothetical protein
MGNKTLTRGIAAGLVGGFVGTFVMDLFGAGLFVVMGGPASLSFAIIGDATAAFFSLIGITMVGGTPLGALVHYLLGPVLGAILGAAASRIDVLRIDSVKRGAGLGILYVEVMSQPLLVTAAIVLSMTFSQAVQWFAVSFIMHLVYGSVLGLVVYYGLRSGANARKAWFQRKIELQQR